MDDQSTPKHVHDCDECVFLGRHVCGGEYAGEYDLYYHPGPLGETVIARHGPEGDYYSGMHFAAAIPLLAEARRRAIERGFLAETTGA